MARYEVLVDDLTLHSHGQEITDLFGNVVGHQHAATIYPKGTILEEDDLTPAMREAVDNGETEGALAKVGDNAEAEVLEPLPGYSDLSVEQVQTLFTVLPSDSIRVIQEYEAEHGEGRAGIVDYHIGRGEAFTDRLTGRAGSPGQEPEEKELLSAIVTREVGEDDFRFGESPNDDGTPQREVGTLEGDDRSEKEKADADEVQSDGADKRRSGARRGRRSAAARTSGGGQQPPKDEDKTSAEAKEEAKGDDDKKGDGASAS